MNNMSLAGHQHAHASASRSDVVCISILFIWFASHSGSRLLPAPLELIDRMATLVPAPRNHRLCYFGALAYSSARMSLHLTLAERMTHELGQAPMRALWDVVASRQGPAAEWHFDDLLHHEARYLADLRLVEALAIAGPMLELGSAPGHMTALLKLTGHAVVGIDLAPERVANLVAEFGLDIRRCDIERGLLPLEDASFAGALLCETFEHLRVDPGLVLSELWRVLTPGAPLLLTTPNVYSIPSLGRFLLGRSVADPVEEFGKLRRMGHMGHVREYSAREVVRFLHAHGFEVESVAYRAHANGRGWKRRLLQLAYWALPKRFRREIVIVARKGQNGPGLMPLP
jgi:SAM-dependent methyltransferase